MLSRLDNLEVGRISRHAVRALVPSPSQAPTMRVELNLCLASLSVDVSIRSLPVRLYEGTRVYLVKTGRHVAQVQRRLAETSHNIWESASDHIGVAIPRQKIARFVLRTTVHKPTVVRAFAMRQGTPQWMTSFAFSVMSKESSSTLGPAAGFRYDSGPGSVAMTQRANNCGPHK